MMNFLRAAALAAGVALCAAPASAGLISFYAELNSAQETPPQSTAAFGTGTVVLDDVQHTLDIALSFSGLTAPATAAHIHGLSGFGVPSPVRVQLSSFVSGLSSGLFTTLIDLDVVGILGTPALTVDDFISGMKSGLTYFNIHNSQFPGGEIRGQILEVPEPASLALFGVGLLVVVWLVRRSRR